MDNIVKEPIRLTFDGNDASNHMIVADSLGKSLQGTGKLYRSACQFYFLGNKTKTPEQEFQVMVGPPEKGSLTYLVWLIVAHGRMGLYPKLLAEAADAFLPELFKSILAKKSGQRKLEERSLEMLYDLAKDNMEVNKRILDYASKVEEGRQKDSKNLMHAIETVTTSLAIDNSSSMKQMVEPIGKTAKYLTQDEGKELPLVIDEVAANLIRAEETLEILEETEIKAELVAIDTINQTCKAVSDDYSHPIRGEITDPVLENTHNVYTQALDNKSKIILKGKPALKEGKLVKFYISDGKTIDELE